MTKDTSEDTSQSSKENAEDNSKKSGLKQRLARLREKYRWLDHLLRMQEHYTRVRGNQLAGAVTYFGFLSFFPLLAATFVVLGKVMGASDTAKNHVRDYLYENLGSVFGQGPGKIDVNTLLEGGAQKAAGIFALVGLLYAGLGWLDATREALRQMWALEPQKMNFVLRKIVDVAILLAFGAAVLASTALSTVATALSDTVLGWVGLEDSTVGKVFLIILGLVLGVFATALIFIILFAKLPGHHLPWKNLFTGALLGAIGVEILKQFGVALLSGTTSNSMYGPFAAIIGLLVYINFVSRVTMYAAAWCVVGPVPTVEEDVAREGETLDEGEAEATSKARHRQDDEDRPAATGVGHDSSGGKVDATTTGLADDQQEESKPADKKSRRKNSRGDDSEQSEPTEATAPRVASRRAAVIKALGAGSLVSALGVVGIVTVRNLARDR